MSRNVQKLKELSEKVKQWSKDRGITVNGKSTTQTLKLVSEISEIFDAYEKNDPQLLKDAIGDSLVVLINLNELINKEGKLQNEINWGPKVIKDHIHSKIIIDLGNLSDAIGKSNYEEASKLIQVMVEDLFVLSEINLVKVEDCLEMAYNEIKDRKGFLNENGNFIKSTDPNYEKLYKEYLEKTGQKNQQEKIEEKKEEKTEEKKEEKTNQNEKQNNKIKKFKNKKIKK